MNEIQKISLWGEINGGELEQYFADLEKMDKEQAKRERTMFRERYHRWPPRKKTTPKPRPRLESNPRQGRLF